MRIRIINENDWEKSYDLDQSIIRIGSQVSCNIQLRDTSVPPLLMQIIRVNDAEIRNIMRFFAPNIMIIRGEQSFPADTNNPYEVFDGDQFNFGKYRMFISLGNDKTRIRTSPHISAEMFISKRELTPESTINGVLELKNLGTEKPCQFRMQISGIPNECVQFSPLPYLYPGASSSVGFIISHLLTKPDPGFTTVSIKISAPDEYFGEELEFNQDIYVAPVFDIVFDLEDDSKDLAGFNKGESPQAKLPEKQAPSLLSIPDTSRLDSSAEVEASAEQKAAPVRIVSAKDTSKNPFDENVNEESTPYSRKKTKEPVVVIRGGKDDAFDGENKEPASNKAAKPEPVAPQRPVRTSKSRVKKSDVKLTPSEKAAAAEFTEKLERNEKARTAPFEVVNEEEERKPEENAAERNLLHDETIKVVSSKQAAESWGPVEEEKPAEVSQLPQEENTVEEKQQKDENVKVVSEEQPFEDWKPAAEEKLAEPQQLRQEEKPVEDDLLSDGNAKVVPAKQAAEKRKPAAEEKLAEPQQPRQEEKTIEDDLLSDGNAKVVPAKQAAQKRKPAAEEKPAEPQQPRQEEKPAEDDLLSGGNAKVVPAKQAAEKRKPAAEEKPAEPQQPRQEEKPVEDDLLSDGNAKVVPAKQAAQKRKPAAEEKPAEPQQPRQEEKPIEDDLLSDGNAKVVPAKQAAQKRKPVAEEKPAEPQQSRQEEKTIEDDLLSDGNAKVVLAKQAAQKRKPAAEEKLAEPQQSRQEEKTIEDDLLSDGNAKVVPAKQAAWEEKPAETQQPAQNEKPAGESGAIGKNDTEDKASAEPAAENKSNSEEESAAMPLMLSEEKQVKRQRKKRVSPAVEKAEKPAEPVPALPAHDMFRDNAGDEAEHLEHNFANKFRPGGDTPVVVVSGGGFDDAGFDENSETRDTGEPSGTQEGNKPQIRVVKGDTFDG